MVQAQSSHRDRRDHRERRQRRAFASMAALAIVFAAGSAAADDNSDAERLFREGQKLLEERRFGEACPKFEAAYSKDRSLGTLINLAFCHKEQGALWYAWLEFREAEVKATELNRPDRRDFAKQRLQELDKQLPKVVLDNPQKVALSDVLVEDRKVWEAERGAVFAAEAGQRKFTFKGRGKKASTMMVNVVKATTAQHVIVPELEDLPPEEHAPAPREIPGEPKKDKEAPPSGTNPGSTQRTIGWVAIGTGGVAAILTGVFGAITYSSPCSGGKPCLQSDKDSAQGTSTIATVSFVVAAVGIIGGAILVLTAPSSSSSAAGQHEPASPRTARLTVVPELGAGWAGLSGSF